MHSWPQTACLLPLKNITASYSLFMTTNVRPPLVSLVNPRLWRHSQRTVLVSAAYFSFCKSPILISLGLMLCTCYLRLCQVPSIRRQKVMAPPTPHLSWPSLDQLGGRPRWRQLNSPLSCFKNALQKPTSDITKATYIFKCSL